MIDSVFVKVKRGEKWAWTYQEWESPAFPYLETRPWTPLLIGGVPCFVASNNPHLNNEREIVPFEGERWCVVWDETRGPWFHDVSNLSGHFGLPVYIARGVADDPSSWQIVWGMQRSQPFEHQVSYEIDSGEIVGKAFDPRKGKTGPPLSLNWSEGEEMTPEGIYEFLIDKASIATVGPLLLPEGDVVRIYDHWPSPEITWWEASVPLVRSGANRRVLVQSLRYDLEMSRTDFLDVLGELDCGGGDIALIQSKGALPASLHPSGFHQPETYLRTLRDCGACLLFEFFEDGETASLTVFGADRLEHLVQNGLIERDDAEPDPDTPTD